SPRGRDLWGVAPTKASPSAELGPLCAIFVGAWHRRGELQQSVPTYHGELMSARTCHFNVIFTNRCLPICLFYGTIRNTVCFVGNLQSPSGSAGGFQSWAEV